MQFTDLLQIKNTDWPTDQSAYVDMYIHMHAYMYMDAYLRMYMQHGGVNMYIFMCVCCTLFLINYHAKPRDTFWKLSKSSPSEQCHSKENMHMKETLCINGGWDDVNTESYSYCIGNRKTRGEIYAMKG